MVKISILQELFLKLTQINALPPWRLGCVRSEGAVGRQATQ
jgi:hypothetical protein